jgi:hypothetical protein
MWFKKKEEKTEPRSDYDAAVFEKAIQQLGFVIVTDVENTAFYIQVVENSYGSKDNLFSTPKLKQLYYTNINKTDYCYIGFIDFNFSVKFNTLAEAEQFIDNNRKRVEQYRKEQQLWHTRKVVL